MKNNSVLVPTDFSKPGNNAAMYAACFAYSSGLPMILLNIYSNMTGPYDATITTRSSSNEIKNISLRKLQLLENQILKKFPSLKISTMAIEGLPRTAIADKANELKPSVIILGSTGMRHLPVGIFGSTALYLFKHAECPVLSIPNGCKWHEPKRIVYATDLKSPNLPVVKALVDLTFPFQSQIDLLHINNYGKEKATELKLSRLKNNLEYEHVKTVSLSFTDEIYSIEEYLKKTKADILAVLHRKRSLVKDLFHFSTIKPLFKEINIPMLVLQKVSKTKS